MTSPRMFVEHVIVERPATTLEVASDVLTGLAITLIAVLALLPTGESVVTQTVSVEVYGPGGLLVRVLLVSFGAGVLATAGTLAMRLRGRAGRTCAVLCSTWAAATLLDAFVTTSRPHEHSLHGLVHITLAVVGLLIQVVLAAIYPLLVRARLRRIPVASLLTSALVVGCGGFLLFASRAGDAGIAERVEFAASALWIAVTVRIAAALEADGDDLRR